MKNIKFKSCLLLGLFLAQACTKDFEKINTPPDTVSNIDPAFILSKAQKDMAFAEGTEAANIQFGIWAQHWAAGLGLATPSRYIQQSDDGNWSEHYNIIRNLSQVRNQILAGRESDPKARTKLAIARIAEISVWQRLTDLFGDVPFSQSALGADDVNSQPKFDTQESIYKTLIRDLDVALSQINATDDSYGAADFYFQGNAAKWKKYGNSLKLKLGMRIRYADPILAAKTATEAMRQPLMESNNDNAAVPTFNDAATSSMHPLLQHWVTGSPDFKYLATALVNQLLATNDPRLPRLPHPTDNSVKAKAPAYKGIGVALTDAMLKTIVKADYSTASQTTFFNKAYTPAIPCLAMSFSDVSFFKAEAALEGWGASVGMAEQFYKDGVKAAMAQSPYNITDIPPSYQNELSFAGLSKEQMLEKIGVQKWIQLFGRSMEAYTEWRRMGYPKLTPGPNLGSTNGTIPRRTVYSSFEILLNKKNYDEAVSRLSHGDSYLSKVWWDKR